MKRVKLILEYNYGKYRDDDEIESWSMNDWAEYFYQSDIITGDLIIKEVIIEK